MLAPGGDADSLPDAVEFGRWGQALLAALAETSRRAHGILSELTLHARAATTPRTRPPSRWPRR